MPFALNARCDMFLVTAYQTFVLGVLSTAANIVTMLLLIYIAAKMK